MKKLITFDFHDEFLEAIAKDDDIDQESKEKLEKIEDEINAFFGETKVKVLSVGNGIDLLCHNNNFFTHIDAWFDKDRNVIAFLEIFDAHDNFIWSPKIARIALDDGTRLKFRKNDEYAVSLEICKIPIIVAS